MCLMRYKNTCCSLLLLSLFFFLLESCGAENSEEKTANFDLENLLKESSVILKIEDSFYNNSDFEKYIHSTIGHDQKTLSLDSLSRLLDSFIEDKIFLQAARNRKLSLTWEEKKEYMAKLSNELKPSESGISLEEINTEILFERLLIDKYIYELVKGIEVLEEEIKEYYDLNKKEYLLPERVEVSQILLKTEDKAIEVLERVKGAPEEEFRKIAQEVSIGVEGSKGGKMGLFEMGQLPFEMEKVIFSLKEGELSLVVESSYGYHIFRLDKKYDLELVPFEVASSSIRMKILDQKIKKRISEHIEDLKNQIEWNFYPQNLSFPYKRNHT